MPRRSNSPRTVIRPLEDGDLDRVIAMMAGLSGAEDMPAPTVDRDALKRWALDDRPRFEGLVATLDGRPVGYLFHHDGFHIAHAAPGLVLMDLFVLPEVRRRGVGRALMAALARRARRRSCTWVSWQARPEASEAVAFYRSLGATRYRAADFELADAAFDRLAGVQ